MKYFLGIVFCFLSITSYAAENKTFDQINTNSQKEISENMKGKNSFNYFRIGPGAIPGNPIFFYPTFGIGKRFQNNNQGFDLSIDVHSAGLINFFSLKGEYLFFLPKSTLQSNHQYYLGMGVNYEAGIPGTLLTSFFL